MYAFKILRLALPYVIIYLAVVLPLNSQSHFDKPVKRNKNLLLDQGVFLKTEYNFNDEKLSSTEIQTPNEFIIPYLFDAVMDKGHKVYDPNFWGSVPVFLQKKAYEIIDTALILKYMNAGLDTSFIVDQSGNWEPFPEYRQMDFKEISGLFFFESWWMDSKSHKLCKDVIAYFPVRQYLLSSPEQNQEPERIKRLVFLVIPDKNFNLSASKKYKPSDFRLLKSGLEYEVNLYNRPYDKYVFREDNESGVQQEEYDAWQYHHFDFYRYFKPENLLGSIIAAVLDGDLPAYAEGNTLLSRNDFIQGLLGDAIDSEMEIGTEALPELIPLDELNGLVFKEDWYINPDNLLIYKDVKSITVIRKNQQYDSYTGEFIREIILPAFTIKFE